MCAHYAVKNLFLRRTINTRIIGLISSASHPLQYRRFGISFKSASSVPEVRRLRPGKHAHAQFRQFFDQPFCVSPAERRGVYLLGKQNRRRQIGAAGQAAPVRSVRQLKQLFQNSANTTMSNLILFVPTFFV